MLQGFITTTHGTTLQVKAKLIYRSDTPVDTAPITSWPTGDIGLSSGWSSIAPVNDPVYTLGSVSNQLSFNGFQLPSRPMNGAMFALVIYTVIF